MPKRQDNIGRMTWNQSAKLWWSVMWRTVLLSVLPIAIVYEGLNLVAALGSSAVYLPILVLVPIVITVQRHVINKISFQDSGGQYRLGINHKTPPSNLFFWDRKQDRRDAIDGDPYHEQEPTRLTFT